jgi:hypothetical protein
MRNIVTFMAALVLLLACGKPPDKASASTPLASENLPKGWIHAGDHPADYEMSLQPTAGRTGKASLSLKAKSDQAQGFGTLMQSIDATDYRGQRVRFSAQVKAQDVAVWAGLWMRVDGPPAPGSKMPSGLAFDNMQNRPIKGTLGWTRYEIVLDVAPEATGISFGILLGGPGQVWMDEIGFDPVAAGVPLTTLPPLPRKPNLTLAP